MEDNYLKLFGNMFYNIKEDQDNKKIIEEASEVLADIRDLHVQRFTVSSA